MRRGIATAALFTAALIVALLLAERGARWFAARPRRVYPTAQLVNDRVGNSSGYQDFEYPKQKRSGTFRIIAVGDSFTQGGGINFDDIYAKRLERYLNVNENVRGRRYEVLQWGWPGHSTPSEVSDIREFAQGFQADLIVLGYCLNDTEDNDDRPGVMALRKSNRLYEIDKGTGFARFLFERSALYRIVKTRIFNTRSNRGQLAYYDAIYRPSYSGLRKTFAALEDLGRLRVESGIPVVVLIFPLLSWDFGDRYPFHDIHGRLHEQLEKAGLPYLDLLPSFRGLDHTVLEAVPFKDPHPSDVAHRLAAEHLYAYLRKNRLLPTGDPIAPTLGEKRVPPPW